MSIIACFITLSSFLLVVLSCCITYWMLLSGLEGVKKTLKNQTKTNQRKNMT
jgi:hypothetical protein